MLDATSAASPIYRNEGRMCVLVGGLVAAGNLLFVWVKAEIGGCLDKPSMYRLSGLELS